MQSLRNACGKRKLQQALRFFLIPDSGCVAYAPLVESMPKPPDVASWNFRRAVTCSPFSAFLKTQTSDDRLRQHQYQFHRKGLLSGQIRQQNRAFHIVCAAGKPKVVFRCSECQAEYPRREGKCKSCGTWNSMEEVIKEPEVKGGGPGMAAVHALQSSQKTKRNYPKRKSESLYDDGPPVTPPKREHVGWIGSRVNNVRERLYDISKTKRGKVWRIPLTGDTGKELGRVLGGGVMPGSMTLLGGDPGIGKSTLLLQLAGMLVEPEARKSFDANPDAPDQVISMEVPSNGVSDNGTTDALTSEHTNGVTVSNSEATIDLEGQEDPADLEYEDLSDEEEPGVLYVSAEESAEQVNSRAERMKGLDMYNIWVLAETRLRSIMEQILDMRPRAVIIDSIQTVYLDEATGTAGSVSQVRECAHALTRVCKEAGIPMFLVGHVTKSGEIAGPRILEHMVDCVLYMEGEASQSLRLLRGIKNRYGATDEVGVFTMDDSGLHPVANPSALFISERGDGSEIASSAVCVTMNGSRPLLVEIQALCSESHQGKERPPLRSSNGIDRSRLNQIEAIVRKYAPFPRMKMDMHTNVIGGFQINSKEVAADLAIAVATASSSQDWNVPPDVAFIGEIGLGGEIRNVSHLERRVSEVSKLGFRRCVIPAIAEDINQKRAQGLKLIKCKNLNEALSAVLPMKKKGRSRPENEIDT